MKTIIKSFPKFPGLLTASSNLVTNISAAGGRYELRNYFRLFFEVGFILSSSILSKNCFKSRSLDFCFLISGVTKGLWGRARQEVVFCGACLSSRLERIEENWSR